MCLRVWYGVGDVCVCMCALRVCVRTYYFSNEHRLLADMYSVCVCVVLSTSHSIIPAGSYKLISMKVNVIVQI